MLHKFITYIIGVDFSSGGQSPTLRSCSSKCQVPLPKSAGAAAYQAKRSIKHLTWGKQYSSSGTVVQNN